MGCSDYDPAVCIFFQVKVFKLSRAKACTLAVDHGIPWLVEHPEDLGTTAAGDASIHLGGWKRCLAPKRTVRHQVVHCISACLGQSRLN